jgi:hypothetical protein
VAHIAIFTILSFVILFILFVIAIEVNERDTLNAAEIAFMIYALGFTLEKIATMQEHGIKGMYRIQLSRRTTPTFLSSLL